MFDQAHFMMLMGQFTQKRIFSHYLLTVKWMEGWVKFFNLQNTTVVSEEKGLQLSPKQLKQTVTRI